MKKIYILGIIFGFLFSANILNAEEYPDLDVSITSPIRANVPGPVTVLTSNEVDLNFITTGHPTSCWYDLGGDEQFSLENCDNKVITLPDGEYNLNLWVTDDMGNEALDSILFNVRTPISVVINNPTDSSALSDNEFELNFTVTGSPTSCWYDLGGLRVEDNSLGDEKTPEYQYSLFDCKNKTITLPYRDDKYTLNLYARNYFGDEDLASIYFSIPSKEDDRPEEDSTKEKKHRSSGSVLQGRVLGASTIDEGRVLGETTSCGIYVDKYLRRGYNNDIESVKKVQKFLNDHMQAGLPETGFYGIKTEQAVKEFQKQNATTVLAPWNISDPTGIFYITTQLAVNNTICPTLKLPNPSPENLISFSKNNLTPKKK